MKNRAEFRVIFRGGPFKEEHWIDFDLDINLYNCAPLPVSREIDEVAAMYAMQQMHERDRIAKLLSAHFTSAVMEVLEKQDTVNGYPRD